MTARLTIAVYVPKDDPHLRALKLAGGSAIVGEPVREDPAMRRIYYEGNVFGASNILTYADRVDCAAAALAHRFPTTATAHVPASALRHVGEFVLATRNLVVHEHQAISALLGLDGELVPDAELVVTTGR